MRKHRVAANRSVQYADSEGSTYNPFRRLRNRFKNARLDVNESSLNHEHSASPIALAREDTPKIYGQLFSSEEKKAVAPADDLPTTIRPVPVASVVANGRVDEEKSSVPLAEAEMKPFSTLRQTLLRRWNPFGMCTASEHTEEASMNKDAANIHLDENPAPTRKRRVIVVEYGNTDYVKESEWTSRLWEQASC